MAAPYPDIQQYMAPYQENAATGAAMVPAQGETNVAVEQQRQAQIAATQAREQAKLKLQEMGYTGKPIQERNEVGGYTFYDTKGNPISAAEYAGMTGSTLGDVLKDSMDKGDIDFLQKYNTFKTISADPKTTEDQKNKIADTLSVYSQTGSDIGKLYKTFGVEDNKKLADTLGLEDALGINSDQFSTLPKDQQKVVIEKYFNNLKGLYDELNYYTTTPVKDVFENFTKEHGNIFFGYNNPNTW